MSQSAVPGSFSPDDPELSERQREVFLALVALHGHTARPVGSETLAHQGRIELSAASIRTTLGELEERGLIDRPHASGGRAPTPHGYGFYVRTLATPAPLPPEMLAEIDRVLSRSAADVERLLEEASRLLSSFTRQLGLALAHPLDDETVTRIDLAPLASRRALMVLDLSVGAVQTVVLELASDLEPAELEDVARVLDERLAGHTFAQVRQRLAGDPELVRTSACRIVARAAALRFGEPVETPLFSAGTMHIAEQPEFASSVRLSPILRVVETGAPLDRLLVSGLEGQVSVRVGLDEDDALAGCSLVSFPLAGAVRAGVGVLGPLRMDYRRALAVVDAVGRRVTEMLA